MRPLVFDNNNAGKAIEFHYFGRTNVNWTKYNNIFGTVRYVISRCYFSCYSQVLKKISFIPYVFVFFFKIICYFAMMKIFRLCFCFLAFLICCHLSLIAQEQPVIRVDKTSSSLIGKSIGVYLPDQEVSFEDVQRANFTLSDKQVPNLGIQAHSVWIKFTVQNTSWSPSLALYIDNPALDEMELFHQQDSGKSYTHQLVNRALPLKDRQYKGADFIFRLDSADTLPSVYYLRIKGNQPIILPMSVNLPSTQLIETIQKNWFNGIYFGIILIMAFYNFFLYLTVRDSGYLHYVLFICCAGMTQLIIKGIAFQYFWPNSPFIEKYSMVFMANLSGIAALLFTRKFLNLRIDYPRLNKLILLLTIPFVISMLLIPFGQYTSFSFALMRSATTFASVIILLVSLFILGKGRTTSAIYFVVAWSFLIIGSIIYLLYNYGFLPYNTLANYSVQLSSAIEMTLFSLALASRIKVLERDRELSRRDALRLAHENERIVKQQNAMLEEQVVIRTKELQQKNEILDTAYESLKQAQAKLVASEKMSSLGRLTAGIAHEINNPINFVAANVNPLKRDFQALFETIEKIEEIGIKEAKAEEKQKEINQIKEDYDFDYLKTEISSLLRGIYDGASRTADIVKGLRIFSRVDEDDLKTADLNEGLRSTLIISNNHISGIDVVTDYGDIPEILCYPGKMNQLFLNIITNAIFAIKEKYPYEGGVLTIKTWREDKVICIAIKDNGIGMNEEVQSKLFEPFFTTKKVGEGTGLGMSIVFSIIEKHNAKLIVNSEPNVGSEFIIQLSSMKAGE